MTKHLGEIEPYRIAPFTAVGGRNAKLDDWIPRTGVGIPSLLERHRRPLLHLLLAPSRRQRRCQAPVLPLVDDPVRRHVTLVHLLERHPGPTRGQPESVGTFELLLGQVVGHAVRLAVHVPCSRGDPAGLGGPGRSSAAACCRYGVHFVAGNERNGGTVGGNLGVQEWCVGREGVKVVWVGVSRVRLHDLPWLALRLPFFARRIPKRIFQQPKRSAERYEHVLGTLAGRPRVTSHAGGHHPRPFPPQLLLRRIVVFGAAAARGLEQFDRPSGGAVRRVQLPCQRRGIGREQVSDPYVLPSLAGDVEFDGARAGSSRPRESGNVERLDLGLWIYVGSVRGLG
mmetsp:Transcript_22680/g.65333  ORF Transcript_22680/g.65333 Transcript_22680/m.65333 type:complete len:341 (-) Transcript_22680:216-1238(-)